MHKHAKMLLSIVCITYCLAVVALLQSTSYVGAQNMYFNSDENSIDAGTIAAALELVVIYHTVDDSNILIHENLYAIAQTESQTMSSVLWQQNCLRSNIWNCMDPISLSILYMRNQRAFHNHIAITEFLLRSDMKELVDSGFSKERPSSKYLVSRFLFGHNLMNTSMGNSNAYTQAATEFAQMLQATMPANIQISYGSKDMSEEVIMTQANYRHALVVCAFVAASVLLFGYIPGAADIALAVTHLILAIGGTYALYFGMFGSLSISVVAMLLVIACTVDGQLALHSAFHKHRNGDDRNNCVAFVSAYKSTAPWLLLVAVVITIVCSCLLWAPMGMFIGISVLFSMV